MKRIARRGVVAVLAATALSLSACGSDEKPAPTSTAADQKTPGVTVDVTIEGGKVTPQGERVEVEAGEEITLHVVTDAADEIHVHSDPEHEFEVAAGDDKTFAFTVDTPGQVAVESHETEQTIVQLVVR